MASVDPADPSSSPGSASSRGPTVEDVLSSDHVWYHTIDLGGGLVTPGRVDLRPYVVHARFPDDLTGCRALDVGTFDGFWAFELERRGAAVVAIDTETIPWPDTPAKHAPSITPSVAGAGFRLLHRYFDSSVDYRLVRTAELTLDAIGELVDLAFVGAILLHLQNPLAALERVRSVLAPGGQIVVMEPVDGPLTEAYPNEPVARWLAEAVKISMWYPNAVCLQQWIDTAGFVDIEMGDQIWYTDTSGVRQLTQTVFGRNPS